MKLTNMVEVVFMALVVISAVMIMGYFMSSAGEFREGLERHLLSPVGIIQD